MGCLLWGKGLWFQNNIIFGFSAAPDTCEIIIRHGTILVPQDGASAVISYPSSQPPASANTIQSLPARRAGFPPEGETPSTSTLRQSLPALYHPFEPHHSHIIKLLNPALKPTQALALFSSSATGWANISKAENTLPPDS